MDHFFSLKSNIDFSSTTFTSIGSSSAIFSGTFDGNNYSLSNISMTASANYAGVFARTTTNANIKNLNISIDSITATGKRYVGGLIGYANNGTFENINININNSISGSDYIAGAFSYITGSTLTNISVTGQAGLAEADFHINASSTNSNSGGIVGYSNGGSTSLNSSSVNDLKIKGLAYIGGLLGNYQLDIFQSYAKNVTLSGSARVGGIAGNLTSGSLENSFAVGGSITATSTRVGGLVGENSSS